MSNFLVVTPGEPAGIGPDIILKAASMAWPVPWIVFADSTLLKERAKTLNISIKLKAWQPGKTLAHEPNTLLVRDVPLATPATPGKLNVRNSTYVLNCLDLAADVCLQNPQVSLVTGPVHKAILHQAGIFFQGHTDYLESYCHTHKTVMLFVSEKFKVALQTRHLPLKKVSDAITQKELISTLEILHDGLENLFQLKNPSITICGLNPHAGEEGYLGKEEIDIIKPAIMSLTKKGFNLSGPVPADTAFLPAKLKQSDVVLAMYHDQGLPIIKHVAFDKTMNVTLGLPFLRTSVDHGTALSLAGTGNASAENFKFVLSQTMSLTQKL